ncbi:MAG TPA: hypothetical protein VFZ27_18075 [Terriglobia bacterium]|nr:hypothetical protein [Terriglobia bacterium]
MSIQPLLAQPDCSAARRVAGLDVGCRVSYHPGLLKVDPVLLSGLQQHSWPGLPALAIPVSVVRAIINRIDCHVLPGQMMNHSVMDRLENINRELVSGHSALIGDDNEQKAAAF